MKRILYDDQMFTFQRFGGVTRYFADLVYNLPADEFVADIPMKFCENHYVTETYGHKYDTIPYRPPELSQYACIGKSAAHLRIFERMGVIVSQQGS